MDWGICQYIDQEGTVHKVAVFVMILGYSRVKYFEFVSRCDLHSLERCMLNGFEYFGGLSEEVLTDNMKTVVIGREAGKVLKVLWNTQFEDFAADVGFIPKVCRVRRPQAKDKVECLVRYVKENFFPGRRFTDLEDLNWQVISWYGVPWQYSGKEVQVRLHNGKLEIYYGEVLVATHQIQHHRGRIIWLPGQYKGLTERNGIAAPYPAAQQQDIQVEIRSLSFYDTLLGGLNHG